MRLLVIEDDATMRRFLSLILGEEGYVVDTTATGDEGRLLALTNDYDGVILDLKLADGDGVDVVRAIRKEGRSVPILVFTGRTARDEVIKALDAGADDYITKPTDAALIAARIRALVRRGQQGTRRMHQDVLQLGNVTLSVRTRRTHVAGVLLQLTPKETMLLEQLLLYAGESVGRAELLEKVWDMHFDPQSNVIDTHVSRLRTKLKAAGATVQLEGVRGAGLMLVATAAD